MDKTIFSIAMLLVCTSAPADTDPVAVEINCEPAADLLRIQYLSSGNTDRSDNAAPDAMGPFDPWDFVSLDYDGNIIAERSIHRFCTLSDGVYEIELGPVPGSRNISTSCGHSMSVWMKVFKTNRLLGTLNSFEEEDCLASDRLIVKDVEVHANHAVLHIEWEKHSSWLLAPESPDDAI